VRQALTCALPPARKVPERSSPALGPWQGLVRQWLVEDRSAPRKQRHTAHRIWVRLRDEHGAVVAESTLRAYVAEVRAEMEDHVGKVMVPQAHAPGAEADVDFGLFGAYIAGTYEPLWMFCVRLSASGRGFHEAFGNQAIESFLEGHVHAFEHFGGVPAGMIRYDNLKDAVIKVLLGRARLENERFVAFRSHYLLTELLEIKKHVSRHIWYPPLMGIALLDSRSHEHRAGSIPAGPGGHRRATTRPTCRHRRPVASVPDSRPGWFDCRGGVGLVR
jgi:hypothetical protein